MTRNGTRWIWLTVALTLVTGVGLGVIADRLLLIPTVFSSGDLRRDRGLGRADHHADHAQRGRNFLEKLNRELNLTDAQQVQLEETLASNHDRAKLFWSRAREDFSQLRQEFRSDIRGVLGPAQQERFDELVAEYDARRRTGRGNKSE